MAPKANQKDKTTTGGGMSSNPLLNLSMEEGTEETATNRNDNRAAMTRCHQAIIQLIHLVLREKIQQTGEEIGRAIDSAIQDGDRFHLKEQSETIRD